MMNMIRMKVMMPGTLSSMTSTNSIREKMTAIVRDTPAIQSRPRRQAKKFLARIDSFGIPEASRVVCSLSRSSCCWKSLFIKRWKNVLVVAWMVCNF